MRAAALALTALAAAGCPVGWTRPAGSTRCYVFLPQVATWGRHNDNCAALWPGHGGTLAVVASSAEALYVLGARCGAPPVDQPSWPSSFYLLGARKAGAATSRRRGWTWADGTSTAWLQSPLADAHWMGGEPSSATEPFLGASANTSVALLNDLADQPAFACCSAYVAPAPDATTSPQPTPSNAVTPSPSCQPRPSNCRSSCNERRGEVTGFWRSDGGCSSSQSSCGACTRPTSSLLVDAVCEQVSTGGCGWFVCHGWFTRTYQRVVDPPTIANGCCAVSLAHCTSASPTALPSRSPAPVTPTRTPAELCAPAPVPARHIRMWSNSAPLNPTGVTALDATGGDATTGGSATASSFAAGSPPSNVVDLSPQTFWESGSDDPAPWVLVTLPAVARVFAVAVSLRTDCPAVCPQRDVGATVELLDDDFSVSWSTTIARFDAVNGTHVWTADVRPAAGGQSCSPAPSASPTSSGTSSATASPSPSSTRPGTPSPTPSFSFLPCTYHGFEGGSLGAFVASPRGFVATVTSAPNVATTTFLYPLTGSYMARLLAGAGAGVWTNLTIDVDGAAGSTVSFDVLFDSGESTQAPGFSDASQVADVTPHTGTVVIWEMNVSSLVVAAGASGWVHRDYAFTASGRHSLQFSVRNVGDNFGSSALLVDNVHVCGPMSTRSPSLTGSSTASATRGMLSVAATPQASPSLPTSPTTTGSAASSRSHTNSPSASAAGSRSSVSVLPSQTSALSQSSSASEPPPSASPTGTSSATVSVTGSSSASGSSALTRTGTPSSSASAHALSASATTSASTPTVSGSATKLRTNSRTGTSTGTGSRTRTSTTTRTRTSTKTRSRSRSRSRSHKRKQ